MTAHACQSASRLACTHPMLGALIPLGLILAVLIGSGLACLASTRAQSCNIHPHRPLGPLETTMTNDQAHSHTDQASWTSPGDVQVSTGLEADPVQVSSSAPSSSRVDIDPAAQRVREAVAYWQAYGLPTLPSTTDLGLLTFSALGALQVAVEPQTCGLETEYPGLTVTIGQSADTGRATLTLEREADQSTPDPITPAVADQVPTVEAARELAAQDPVRDVADVPTLKA